ncbi:MAG: GreA/GreB family elongation factor [Actinomycetota bacterium]
MTERPDDVVVSAETLERMRGELDELETTGRSEMGERLQRAREFGDIRENAEYDAAKDAQALMESRIRQLQHLIKHAVVRDPPASVEEAGPGVIVSVREQGEEEVEQYLLAVTNEERVSGIRTVTTSSPLGKALAGKRVGETVRVEAPGGAFSVEVVDLRPSA